MPAIATTPTGTRVIVLAEHELPMVHVLVTVAAGSALDPPQRPGLAAAVASMLQDGGAGGAHARPRWRKRSPSSAPSSRSTSTPIRCSFRSPCWRATSIATLALLGDLLARPRFDCRRLAARAGAAHRRDPSPARRARARRRRRLRARALRRPSVRPRGSRHARLGRRDSPSPSCAPSGPRTTARAPSPSSSSVTPTPPPRPAR